MTLQDFIETYASDVVLDRGTHVLHIGTSNYHLNDVKQNVPPGYRPVTERWAKVKGGEIPIMLWYDSAKDVLTWIIYHNGMVTVSVYTEVTDMVHDAVRWHHTINRARAQQTKRTNPTSRSR